MILNIDIYSWFWLLSNLHKMLPHTSNISGTSGSMSNVLSMFGLYVMLSQLVSQFKLSRNIPTWGIWFFTEVSIKSNYRTPGSWRYKIDFFFSCEIDAVRHNSAARHRWTLGHKTLMENPGKIREVCAARCTICPRDCRRSLKKIIASPGKMLHLHIWQSVVETRQEMQQMQEHKTRAWGEVVRRCKRGRQVTRLQRRFENELKLHEAIYASLYVLKW